jgi:membrane protein YdbS with pleckstrin-like domain
MEAIQHFLEKTWVWLSGISLVANGLAFLDIFPLILAAITSALMMVGAWVAIGNKLLTRKSILMDIKEREIRIEMLQSQD